MSMHHAEAMKTFAAERYVLGELTEQQALAYEEHFFDCRECAEEVKAATALADDGRETFRTQPAVSVPQFRPPRRRRLALFWPLPMGAAAAILLVAGAGAYQAVVVVPALRHQVAQSDALQAAPQFFLSISRSEPQVLTLAPGQRKMGLTLSRSSERSSPFYRCQVLDSAGRVVESAIMPGPQGGDELQLLLPTSRLRSGSYRIELAALAAPGDPLVERDVVSYQFELRREGER